LHENHEKENCQYWWDKILYRFWNFSGSYEWQFDFGAALRDVETEVPHDKMDDKKAY